MLFKSIFITQLLRLLQYIASTLLISGTQFRIRVECIGARQSVFSLLYAYLRLGIVRRGQRKSQQKCYIHTYIHRYIQTYIPTQISLV